MKLIDKLKNMTEVEIAQYEVHQREKRLAITKKTCGISDDAISQAQHMLSRAIDDLEVCEFFEI